MSRREKRKAATPEEIQQIAKMWNDGIRMEDIEAFFGMGKKTVQAIAQRHRDLMPARVRNVEWHEGAPEKIAAMRSQGVTLDAIADHFGVSRTTIRKIATQHKVKLEKPKPIPAPAKPIELSGIRKTEHVTITGARISLPYVSFKVIGAEARA